MAEPEPLPSGWIKRFTEDGRAYYQNNINKTTQWNPPPVDKESKSNATATEQEPKPSTETEENWKEKVYFKACDKYDMTGMTLLIIGIVVLVVLILIIVISVSVSSASSKQEISGTFFTGQYYSAACRSSCFPSFAEFEYPSDSCMQYTNHWNSKICDNGDGTINVCLAQNTWSGDGSEMEYVQMVDVSSLNNECVRIASNYDSGLTGAVTYDYVCYSPNKDIDVDGLKDKYCCYTSSTVDWPVGADIIETTQLTC